MPKDNLTEMDLMILRAKDDAYALDVLAQETARSITDTALSFFIPTTLLPTFGDELPTWQHTQVTTVDLRELWDDVDAPERPSIHLELLHHNILATLLPPVERAVWEWLDAAGYVHKRPLEPDSEALQDERGALWVGHNNFLLLSMWENFQPFDGDSVTCGRVGRVIRNNAEYVVLCDSFRYDTLYAGIVSDHWAYVGEHASPRLKVLPSMKVRKGVVTISLEVGITTVQ